MFHIWTSYIALLLFSRSIVSSSLWSHGLQASGLPCPSSSLGACSQSCPLSQWCHPTISSCHPHILPSIFPSIRVFSNKPLFPSGSQSIGVSISASVLPMNIQDWIPGLNSLLSTGISRVFPNTTVQKHQIFSAQPSLWSSSHIYTWLLEKP